MAKRRFVFHDPDFDEPQVIHSQNKANDYLMDHSYMGTKPLHMETWEGNKKIAAQTYHPGGLSFAFRRDRAN